MSSDLKPLVTIVGALSKQGRSATRTLLDSGRYRVRALTRRVGSVAAQALAARGAELVQVSMDLGNRRGMVDAFAGSDSVFLMTPPIAPPALHEASLGVELADAAVEAGVPHMIFSSLEDVEGITEGAKYAPHFTDKARVERHIRSLPVQSSFIMLAFFYTNLSEYYTPRLRDDELVFPIYLPKDFRAPFVDPTTATGPAVLEILSRPDHYAGLSLPVIGEILSPEEMVETFSRVTGRKATYSSAYENDELIRHFPDFAANPLLVEEILGMARFAVENGYYGAQRDLGWSRRIDPGSLTWEGFLRQTGWQGQPRSFDA